MAADQNAAEVMPQLQLDSQLCFPLYAASRKVVNHYTPFLKPFGITYTQYIVLLALWEVKTSTVGELCDRLYLDNGTVTPLLKKMEEEGLVTRTRSKKDERVVTVDVTENGRISAMFPSRSASASLWSRMKRLPSISFSANCWRIWTEQNRKTDKRTGQTGLCAFSVMVDSVFRSGRLPIQPGCLLRRDRERSRR